MGNSRSIFMCRESEVEWQGYASQEWRSERVRELDKLGGLDRPVIKRGCSMTAKLEYLQASLQKQSKEMEDALYRSEPRRPDKKSRVKPKSMLRTDLRALERGSASEYQIYKPEVEMSWEEQQAILHLEKVAARKKRLAYNDKAGRKLVQWQTPHSLEDEGQLKNAEGSKEANGVLALHAPGFSDGVSDGISDWRLRIHRARRRVILIVLTAVRLRRGLGHPHRLNRVDPVFFIPLALGDEYGRFIEEQTKHKAICDDMQIAKASLEEHLKSGEAHKDICPKSLVEADAAFMVSPNRNWHRARSESNVPHSARSDYTMSRAGFKELRSISDFGPNPNASAEAAATAPPRDRSVAHLDSGLASGHSQVAPEEDTDDNPRVRSISGGEKGALVPTNKYVTYSRLPPRTSRTSHVPLIGLPAVIDVIKKQQNILPSCRKSLKPSGSARGAAEKMAKISTLTQKIDVQQSMLQQSEQLLSMHANRANSVWADKRSWDSGQAVGLQEQSYFKSSEDFAIYKADLVRMLRRGQVVFQFFAAEDDLLLPGGTYQNLWTADPWALVQAARPGSMPIAGERIEGLTLGARALTQLRLGVEALAGLEAVRAMTVVLHLHEGQREEVLGDLVNRRHYGINGKNVFITVQSRSKGYRFDPSTRHFVEAGEEARPGQRQACCSLGAGYGMMQMGWVADAFTLDEAGGCHHLKGTLLEELKDRGTKWLISRRSRDLAIMSKEGALNEVELTQMLHLQEKARATIITQTIWASNPSTMRQMDSLVLSLKPTGSALPVIAPQSCGGADTEAAVVELRCCELSSTSMADVVTHKKTNAGGEMLVGLQRYAFHMKSLQDSLSHINAFRPKLLLNGTTVRVALELSDLTSVYKAKTVAVISQDQSMHLMSSLEVESLVPLIKAQDQNMSFRKAAGSSRVSNAAIVTAELQTPRARSVSASGLSADLIGGRQPWSGQRIVIFCADNQVTQAAVDTVALMNHAGRDQVLLVTVVPTTLQLGQGRALVTRYHQQLSQLLIQAKTDVIVKGNYSGLLDCLESYVAACDATLVVMGSQAMTSQVTISGTMASAALVGSVTLSCIKRLAGLPMVVVTANTRIVQLNERGKPVKQLPGGGQQQAASGKRDPPRVLAVVEPHAKDMVQFLSSTFLDPLRGDSLMLGQVFASRLLTTQQQSSARRLMDSFSDIAAGHHISLFKAQLDGPMDKALQAFIEDRGPHMVALQLKSGDRTLSPEVLNLLRCSKAAVMLYR